MVTLTGEIDMGMCKKKLRWYPQQRQRFIFTEACCEAKRWKHLAWVSVY